VKGTLLSRAAAVSHPKTYATDNLAAFIQAVDFVTVEALVSNLHFGAADLLIAVLAERLITGVFPPTQFCQRCSPDMLLELTHAG
jgi:hypothetical protein